MDRGYELSPMANLFCEYGTERETGPSTARVVANIATKPNLSREDVVDTQDWNNNIFTRYRLQEPELSLLQQTITELQIFIQRMARLIPERTSYFLVDPEDNATCLLGGSQTPAQLQAAWTMIAKRMEAAQQFILKYQEEYKGGTIPSSPVSTNNELHAELKDISLPESKLRYVYAEFPRHSAARTSADRREIRAERSWDHIVTIPAWMREEDENSVEGPYEPTLSSVGKQTERETGPRKKDKPRRETDDVANRRVSFAPSQEITTGSIPLVPPQEATPSGALLGSGTPFRSQTTFFKGAEGETVPLFPRHRKEQQPGATGNLLHGLATPSGPSSFQTPRFNPVLIPRHG
jgi:hypothetical protein